MKTAATADGICSFIDASPSPFHVCESVAKVLDDNGFSPLDETQSWPAGGRHYVIRGGSIIAWDDSRSPGQAGGRSLSRAFRIVGGHTDSPNLRLKQHPDGRFGDMRMVALEPYGGAWLNSWLDRDLGLSGRISVTGGNALEHKLVQIQAPILRVPQLAIHLSEDRKAVKLDPQRHVNAILGIGDGPTIFELVAATTGSDPRKIVGWELMTHDVAPSRVVGIDQELISAPRLDNQGTCYAGLNAFVAALGDQRYVPVLSLFDHEEVGSGSDRGAASNFLSTVLERIILARGGSRDDYLQAMAASACASGDMAHATHPNYPDRHEPSHEIWINGGPVLKVNQNLRYASDADGEGLFALAAEQAGVPLQRYVHRADLPCGSTIGPITATRTGLTTVDVGAPQLAMHSAREMMGAADVGMYASALAAFLRPQ